jgi:EmrB/QacA subfamily drug resistance transporter
LSWSAGSLIVFRVVQGAAAGGAMALMTTIITRAAGGKNLGRIMALLGLPMLIIPLIGPVIGGAIITGVSWRWMFWINVPLCLAGIWLAARFLDRTPGMRGEPLDIVGLVTLACGSALVLYGFASAASAGTFTSTRVIGCLIAGVALLAASVWWTLRASHPIVDLRLMRIPTFLAATVTIVLSGFMTNAGTLVLPLFFQQVRGSTALIAGGAVIPQALGSLATRTLAGKLTDRIGARWVVVTGTAIAALATIPLAFADAHTSWWVIGVALFVRGTGLSGVYVPAMSVAYLDVPKAQIASSSIITRMLNNVGGTFGAALVAVTIQWVGTAMGFSLVSSYRTAFWLVIAFTSLTLVSGFFLPRRGTGAAAAGA